MLLMAMRRVHHTVQWRVVLLVSWAWGSSQLHPTDLLGSVEYLCLQRQGGSGSQPGRLPPPTACQSVRNLTHVQPPSKFRMHVSALNRTAVVISRQEEEENMTAEWGELGGSRVDSLQQSEPSPALRVSGEYKIDICARSRQYTVLIRYHEDTEVVTAPPTPSTEGPSTSPDSTTPVTPPPSPVTTTPSTPSTEGSSTSPERTPVTPPPSSTSPESPRTTTSTVRFPSQEPTTKSEHTTSSSTLSGAVSDVTSSSSTTSTTPSNTEPPSSPTLQWAGALSVSLALASSAGLLVSLLLLALGCWRLVSSYRPRVRRAPHDLFFAAHSAPYEERVRTHLQAVCSREMAARHRGPEFLP